MKTAISIPDALFHEAERVAKENHISRSEVFASALRDYLEKRKSKRLLQEINEAFTAAETAEEYSVRQKSKKHYARSVRRTRP
jgi:metal-responsive CopG/Arc/MetJ family transcriptional regulator